MVKELRFHQVFCLGSEQPIADIYGLLLVALALDKTITKYIATDEPRHPVIKWCYNQEDKI